MTDMVNSREEKLDVAAITHIALENTKSKYPTDVAFAAILKEMTLPDTIVQQYGNTVFIAHVKGNLALFKALNADIAPNFFQNSILFLGFAKKKGLQTLVTEFNDENIYRMIQMIAANPPFEGMGMKVEQLNDGDLRVSVNLGD